MEEKAGDVTGNEDLKRKGEKDQLKGHVQEGVGKVEHTADDAMDS